MNVKTSELTGPALDWVVAKCEIRYQTGPDNPIARPLSYTFRPSTCWEDGGPIIERERIQLSDDVGMQWIAFSTTQTAYGPTQLVAAMRAYIAEKLGDEVEIPEELMK